ncbi:MAG TPA: DUF2155 domain-containing protein [Stellaceae bacterium]|nr:DUF2155 domain-containing protein [Stellaceae bacterium]
MKRGLIAAATILAADTAFAAGHMTPEPVAVLQGLDKITARVSRFDAPVGRPVSFGTLSLVVQDCERSAPEERPENAAFVQIYEQRPGEERVRLFSGWMFSSSPALSALEHPVYDVNLLDCKAAAGSSSPAAAPATASPAGRSAGKTAR